MVYLLYHLTVYFSTRIFNNFWYYIHILYKTKTRADPSTWICKRICPCCSYRFFARDFSSAAISGFARSFWRSA